MPASSGRSLRSIPIARGYRNRGALAPAGCRRGRGWAGPTPVPDGADGARAGPATLPDTRPDGALAGGRDMHGQAHCASPCMTRRATFPYRGNLIMPAPDDPRMRSMRIAASFEIEYLQYLGPDGTLVAALPAAAPPADEVLELFRQMLFLRTFDGKAVALQRTGKLGTYAPCLGHEATQIGIGAMMRPEDVLAPSYREYGTQIMRGVQLREILLYWGGDERGNDYQNEPARHDFPWAVPIATQCLHAAGAALAFKLRGEKRVAVTCC